MRTLIAVGGLIIGGLTMALVSSSGPETLEIGAPPRTNPMGCSIKWK